MESRGSVLLLPSQPSSSSSPSFVGSPPLGSSALTLAASSSLLLSLPLVVVVVVSLITVVVSRDIKSKATASEREREEGDGEESERTRARLCVSPRNVQRVLPRARTYVCTCARAALKPYAVSSAASHYSRSCLLSRTYVLLGVYRRLSLPLFRAPAMWRSSSRGPPPSLATSWPSSSLLLASARLFLPRHLSSLSPSYAHAVCIFNSLSSLSPALLYTPFSRTAYNNILS